jgi:chaperonin GroEL
MSLFQVNKPKSAAKVMVAPGNELKTIVLSTMEHVAKMVGTTLGPGGRQVLIERPEIGLKPIMTKDGVTVIKHLGYDSATQQLVLEAVRDAAMRTASEAGDGTTTATILAESITQKTSRLVDLNPKLSPQKIVRELEKLMPFISEKIDSYKINIDGENAEETLHKVASLSANGDSDLADSIIEAFNTVGDEGNITIIEATGPSKYEIEKVSGYTLEKGYEESCRNFSNGFINDKSGTMITLEKPIVILFDGVVNDISQILESMNRIGQYFTENSHLTTGIVIIAHGFSDSVVGDLHLNWNKGSFKVLPLITTQTAVSNSRTEQLYDLQAYTSSPVFNPIDRPLVDMNIDFLVKKNRVKNIEVGRFRSSIIVEENESLIETRVEELKLRRQRPESQYEAHELDVRIGKLTSGIARLNIYGLSQGETREKRDRAEDAWMAIRGTVKYGAVPGGGYVLSRLSCDLLELKTKTSSESKKVALEILSDALIEPVKVLYKNYGFNDQETDQMIGELLQRDYETFDLSDYKWKPKEEVLDSAPAVLEAIRNSMSIASLLGTMGGLIAFKRDKDSDKEEEGFVRRFERGAGLRE